MVLAALVYLVDQLSHDYNSFSHLCQLKMMTIREEHMSFYFWIPGHAGEKVSILTPSRDHLPSWRKTTVECFELGGPSRRS
jgi:hypothetical protein